MVQIVANLVQNMRSGILEMIATSAWLFDSPRVHQIPPHSPPPRCLRHLATRRFRRLVSDAFGVGVFVPPHFQKSGYAMSIFRSREYGGVCRPIVL